MLWKYFYSWMPIVVVRVNFLGSWFHNCHNIKYGHFVFSCTLYCVVLMAHYIHENWHSTNYNISQYYNGHKLGQSDKNDLQNTTQKMKIEQHEWTPLNITMKLGALEGQLDPAQCWESPCWDRIWWSYKDNYHPGIHDYRYEINV